MKEYSHSGAAVDIKANEQRVTWEWFVGLFNVPHHFYQFTKCCRSAPVCDRDGA